MKVSPSTPAQLGARWIAALLVLGFTWFAFSPALDGAFLNWDDEANLVQNPHYRGLSPGHLRWMFTTTHLGPYQPLSWLSLALDHAVWGMNPYGYHLTNLALHAANALLLFLLIGELLRLGRGPAGRHLVAASAAGALFFSVHPLRVESVAWITERRDVLSGFFALSCVLAHVRMCAAPSGSGSRRRWYGASIGCFALSLLSKASPMALPVALLVLDVHPLRRIRSDPDATPRALVLEKLPHFLLSCAAATIALVGQRASGAMDAAADLGWLERIVLAAHGYAFYLWKTVAPFGLSPIYPFPEAFDPTERRFVISAVAVTTATAILFVIGRRRPALLATWLAYLVLALPVIGVVPVGLHLAADRYTYLPCIPFAVLFGAAVRGALGVRALRSWATALAVLSLLWLGWTAQRQARVWRTSTALWTHALRLEPRSFVAHHNLAVSLETRGHVAEARLHYEQALEVRPDDSNARYGLARTLALAGDHASAVRELELVVAESPEHFLAWHDLGAAHLELGDPGAAARCAGKAVELAPGHAGAHFVLGRSLLELGHDERAEQSLRTALRLDRDLAAARDLLRSRFGVREP